MSNAPVDQTADVAQAHAATAPAGALTGKVGKSRTQSSDWGHATREAMLDYMRRNKDDLTAEEAAVKFGLKLRTAAHYLSVLAGKGIVRRVSVYSLVTNPKEGT